MPDLEAQRLPLPHSWYTLPRGLVPPRSPSPSLSGWSRESCPQLSPVPILGNQPTSEFAGQKGLQWFRSC